MYALCAFIYLVRSSKTFGTYNVSLNGFEYEVSVLVTKSFIPI